MGLVPISLLSCLITQTSYIDAFDDPDPTVMLDIVSSSWSSGVHMCVVFGSTDAIGGPPPLFASMQMEKALPFRSTPPI